VTRLAALSSSGSSLPGVSSLVNVPPRPIRDGTRDLYCPGVCPLRAAPPDSSPSAPSLPLASASLTRFPRLPWRRPSTSRSSSAAEMQGSFAVLPALELAPLFRFHPPLGRESPLRNLRPQPMTSSTLGVGFQDLDSAETKPSLWSPRLQRFPGEMVWRPSPGLATPLEVSSL
jgi:hypothetical protein